MYFSKFRKEIYSLFLWLPVFFSPVSVFAQTTAANSMVKLKNPLAVDSIQDLLEALLSIVIIIAVPLIVFFIIYAGFMYVTARGNAEQVKQATNALTYAVIGGVLIIGAMAIVTIVGNLVGSFTP